MRKISLLLILGLLVTASCIFALRGSGNYEYEIESELPDTLDAPTYEVLQVDSLDEGIDDEFDLLDDEYDSEGEKTWPE